MREPFDECEAFRQGVLAVGGGRDAEGHVVGKRGAGEAVVGHAVGILALRGFDLETPRSAQVQGDRHLGEPRGVLGVRVDLHRGISGDVAGAAHRRRNGDRPAFQFVHVQLNDRAFGERGDGQVPEDGAAVEARVDLAQGGQGFGASQRPTQRALDGPGVEAAAFDTGPCVHPPIVPRSGAAVEMSAPPRNNCAYG